TKDDSLFVAAEFVNYWDKSRGFASPLSEPIRPAEGGREAGVSDPRVIRIASWVRLRLGLFRLFHVHDTSASSPMRTTSKLNDNAFLRSDASNLSAFL